MELKRRPKMVKSTARQPLGRFRRILASEFPSGRSWPTLAFVATTHGALSRICVAAQFERCTLVTLPCDVYTIKLPS
jgi:hypothetical protein